MTKVNLLVKNRGHGRLTFLCALMMAAFLVSTLSQAWVDQGIETAPGEFPAVFGFHMTEEINISTSMESLCTGFLVSPTLILTAAHCLNGQKRVSSVANGIRIGSKEAGASSYSVTKFGSHPDYTTAPRVLRVEDPEFQKAIANDVGYIVLKKPIMDVTPLPLFIAKDLNQCSELWRLPITTIGYGADSFKDVIQNSGSARMGIKRKGTRAIDEVHGAGVFLTTGDQYGVLPGDSGGPMIADLKGAQTVVAINHSYSPGIRKVPSDGQHGKMRDETYYQHGVGTLLTPTNLCWVVRDSGEKIPGLDCSQQ